jgi:hypothetical protein
MVVLVGNIGAWSYAHDLARIVLHDLEQFTGIQVRLGQLFALLADFL